MPTYDQYAETNLVRSIVLYDWNAATTTAGARDVFDVLAAAIGRPPDIATVLDEKKERDYLYKNFFRRGIIDQKEWLEFGYLWKRSEDVLSDFAIEAHFVPDKFRCVTFHLDEAATDDSLRVYETVAGILVNALQPIYGIGYTMPYYWGPRAFATGTISSRYAIADKTFYGAPEQMKRQAQAFRGEYLADNDRRNLDHMLRDVFEINFLSKGHLERRVEGRALKDWIGENAVGKLQQLTSVCWRWDVPLEKIERIRRVLIEAGSTVVKE